MNIMTGCLAASAGEVKIGGFDIFEEPTQAKCLIGYLPEQPPVYLDRTPWSTSHLWRGPKMCLPEKSTASLPTPCRSHKSQTWQTG